MSFSHPSHPPPHERARKGLGDLAALVAQGVKAGEIANAIAAVSGGRGGGRAHFASAGAGDPARLALARAQSKDIVARFLGR